MTRYEIAVLACKILALWVMVEIIMDVANLLSLAWYFIDHAADQSWRAGSIIMAYGPILIMTIAQCAIAWFLWFRAPRLAARMVSTDPTPVTSARVTKDDIMTIAFSAVGVYLLVQGIDSMVLNLLEYRLGFEHGVQAWYSAGWQSQLWSSVIHIIIAIWLMLGSRGIVQFLNRMRTAGVHHNPIEPSEIPPPSE